MAATRSLVPRPPAAGPPAAAPAFRFFLAARLADARGSEVHHDGQELVVYLGAAGPWRSGAGNVIAGRAVHQPPNSRQSLA